MDADAEQFQAWRAARRWRLMACIATGAATLAAMLALGAMTYRMGVESGRRVDPRLEAADQKNDAPASTPAGVIDLKAAMHHAAQQLDLALLELRTARRTKQDNPSLADHLARYRDLLGAGAPICLGGVRREVSQAFAEALAPPARTAWLASALQLTTGMDRRAASDIMASYGVANIPTTFGWGWETLEAVHNLTNDPALRAGAQAAWNSLAATELAEKLAAYSECLRQPGCYGTRPVPRKLPDWSRPDVRRLPGGCEFLRETLESHYRMRGPTPEEREAIEARVGECEAWAEEQVALSREKSAHLSTAAPAEEAEEEGDPAAQPGAGGGLIP
jgi:hypothetical protein